VLGVSVEYGRSSRRDLYGLGMDNTGTGLGPEFGIGRLKLGIKRGSKIVFSGAPGRGVLRFSGQAYRNSVHFLAIFRVFSKN